LIHSKVIAGCILALIVNLDYRRYAVDFLSSLSQGDHNPP
jgi:hypothetical protein